MASGVSTGKMVGRFVITVVAGIVLIVAGIILAPVLTKYVPLLDINAESRNTEVIQSITREEQVVLLSLGIQGIEEKNQTATNWFEKIPFTERTTLIQYGFNAKLGIEGEDVAIQKTGEESFLVTIPKFIFIGHDNLSFKTAHVDNDLLSFATEEIHESEMITTVLNSDAQKEYISKNQAILRDQAENFYEEIITSIDPTVVVEFEFKD